MHSRLVVVEPAAELVVALTTANHLVSILAIPANFDLLAQTAISASVKTSDDQNASTPRILAVTVAGLAFDSVESPAKQQLMPRGHFSTTDPRRIAQNLARQGRNNVRKIRNSAFWCSDFHIGTKKRELRCRREPSSHGALNKLLKSLITTLTA